MLQNETNARLVRASKKNNDGDIYIGIIDVLHEVVHEGKMHTVSSTSLNVADNGYFRIRLKAGATKDIHARLAWASEGKSRLKTYTGTTYSNNGTPYTPFNRDTGRTNTMEALVYLNPVIDVLGTQRGDDFVGVGGAVAQRIGGTGASDVETIIAAGTELLIEVQNVRGSASDLNIICNIYERLAN